MFYYEKYIQTFPVICLLVIIGISMAGCKKEAVSKNGQNAALVCFGTSLTAGHGAVTPGVDDAAKSYPAFLQNKINIPVINAGVTGDTSSKGLSRINTDVISKNPQIVIIEFGGNDFFQDVPLADIRDNLQNIISLLNNGSRKIYLAKFYTEPIARDMVNSRGGIDYDEQTAWIIQYDDMFNTLASSNNVTLIEDIWAGVWGIHMSDGVHPNARGYEIMADNYFNALQPYLQENNFIK